MAKRAPPGFHTVIPVALSALLAGVTAAGPAQARQNCEVVIPLLQDRRSECRIDPAHDPTCAVVDAILAEVLTCCFDGGRYGVIDETCLCDVFYPAGPVRTHSLMCTR